MPPRSTRNTGSPTNTDADGVVGVPLFRPIEHPVLRGLSTSNAVRFLEQRGEYEYEVQEQNKQPNVNMVPVSYLGSITRSLAEALIRVRKFGPDIDEYSKLTDDAVKKYVKELAGKSPAAPDSEYLESLISKVQMRPTVRSRTLKHVPLISFIDIAVRLNKEDALSILQQPPILSTSPNSLLVSCPLPRSRKSYFPTLLPTKSTNATACMCSWT